MKMLRELIDLADRDVFVQFYISKPTDPSRKIEVAVNLDYSSTLSSDTLINYDLSLVGFHERSLKTFIDYFKHDYVLLTILVDRKFNCEMSLKINDLWSGKRNLYVNVDIAHASVDVYPDFCE